MLWHPAASSAQQAVQRLQFPAGMKPRSQSSELRHTVRATRSPWRSEGQLQRHEQHCAFRRIGFKLDARAYRLAIDWRASHAIGWGIGIDIHPSPLLADCVEKTPDGAWCSRLSAKQRFHKP